MFSELLIGMPGWYSSRCALTWKLKATKSGRVYFQLVASTLRTDGTEPSLLHTPRATEIPERPERFSQRTGDRSATCFPNLTSQVLYGGLVPTPTAQDFKRRGPNSHQQGLPEFVRKLLPTPNAVEGTKWARTYNPNSQMGKGLSAMAVNDMLPTPKAADGTGGGQTVTGRTVTRPSGQTFSTNLRDLAKSDLLPTPLSTEVSHIERIKKLKEKGGTTMGSRKNGELRPNGLMDYLMFHDFLPTPEASNCKNGHRTVSPRIERKVEQGWAIGLNDLATLSLLPTPVTCLDGVYADKNPDSKRHSKSIATLAYEAGGRTSQLSPLFVEEMMGFPTGWILLPFLKESLLRSVQSLSTDGEVNP